MSSKGIQKLSESFSLLSQNTDKTIRLTDIFLAVEERGFGLLLLLLSLPSALPLPAVGYSTPFGVLTIIVGAQMLLGRKSIWLPKNTKRIKIKHSLAHKMLHAAETFFSKIEWMVKPRLSWWDTRMGHALIAVLVIVMGFLMSLPIPTTNTAPAMIVFLVGIGLCEKDGLFCMVALALGIGAIATYTYVLHLCYFWMRAV